MNSRPALPLYDAPSPVMREAGAWLARRDRGFTPAEQAEFDFWLNADPRRAAAVAQLNRTMATFDRLRAPGPADGAALDPDAFAPPRKRTNWLYPAIAAGLAAALAVLIWTGRSPAGAWHFATAVSGYEKETLADGSTVELNSDTALDVRFTPTERAVRLARGEAHFQVAKNPVRPFIVTADGVTVRAVGTVFDVRLGQAAVEVLVTEGRVRVDPPVRPTVESAPTAAPEIPLLTAGQRIVVSTVPKAPLPTATSVSPEEIDRALAWQPRVSEFRRTPLSQVVAEFNRGNRVQIVIADPALESLRLGGNFRADEPEAFVRLLEASFGVRAERSGDVITLRKGP